VEDMLMPSFELSITIIRPTVVKYTECVIYTGLSPWGGQFYTQKKYEHTTPQLNTDERSQLERKKLMSIVP
jgi:hypothetical protein